MKLASIALLLEIALQGLVNVSSEHINQIVVNKILAL